VSPDATARVRPRLRTRLTAWYAGVLLVALLATAAGIRYAVERTLARTFTDSLDASIALVQRFFRVEIAEFQSIDATVTHMASELVFEDRVIDIHRPDGSVFALPGRDPSNRYPQLATPVRDRTAPLDPLLAPGWTVEVHASEAALVAARRRLDVWLLAGIPLVMIAATVIGWWLAGRALRPIGALAAQAHALDASRGGRLVVSGDADELAQLGTSFNALLDRLDTALAQQRRFLADAAHELRTPIARLRGRVELARLGLASPDRTTSEAVSVDATFAALDAELRDTSEVVQGLLALARADAEVDAASFEEGYLDDALADELPRWRESAAQAGVTVSVDSFDEVRAKFDAALMRRLLALLLDNAIRYTPAPGQVTVSLRAVHDASHARAVLEVSDTGIGVGADDREAVFERFHRTADARAHRPDGSGLGLALARWIVQRHGGTIALTSRADGTRGTRVLVELPRLVAPHQVTAREVATREIAPAVVPGADEAIRRLPGAA
jgi:two-component system, OmpR family, sensor kinase